MKQPIYLKESEANEPPAHRAGIYPVPPPLVQGGQGKSDEDLLASGKYLFYAAVFGFSLLGAFFLACCLVKVFA